jgi:hypothetical protein
VTSCSPRSWTFCSDRARAASVICSLQRGRASPTPDPSGASPVLQRSPVLTR